MGTSGAGAAFWQYANIYLFDTFRDTNHQDIAAGDSRTGSQVHDPDFSRLNTRYMGIYNKTWNGTLVNEQVFGFSAGRTEIELPTSTYVLTARIQVVGTWTVSISDATASGAQRTGFRWRRRFGDPGYHTEGCFVYVETTEEVYFVVRHYTTNGTVADSVTAYPLGLAAGTYRFELEVVASRWTLYADGVQKATDTEPNVGRVCGIYTRSGSGTLQYGSSPVLDLCLSRQRISDAQYNALLATYDVPIVSDYYYRDTFTAADGVLVAAAARYPTVDENYVPGAPRWWESSGAGTEIQVLSNKLVKPAHTTWLRQQVTVPCHDVLGDKDMRLGAVIKTVNDGLGGTGIVTNSSMAGFVFRNEDSTSTTNHWRYYIRYTGTTNEGILMRSSTVQSVHDLGNDDSVPHLYEIEFNGLAFEVFVDGVSTATDTLTTFYQNNYKHGLLMITQPSTGPSCEIDEFWMKQI
jgi:hypothetical protein